jgi:pyruvate-formate lyase-activating enzyme
MLDPELSKIASTLREIPFPTRFAVEVCADCNLACSMCHHPDMRRPKGTMPFELWKKCADEIAAISPKTQCWFSFCGEPLLEPELLFRMLSYGKSVGLKSLNVNSNGMLLVPELADPLMDTGVDLIVIGIDGYTADTYERIRIHGKRDELYSNVESLLAARGQRREGPEIQVQFIVMGDNEHELDDFRSYWLERGATVKVRNKLSWGGIFETPLDIPNEERIPCPWALSMMHVFWDGRVPRCPGDTEGEEGVGNVWHESLPVLWKKLGPYREKHLQHRFDELPDRCQTCKDWMTGAAVRVHPEAATGGQPDDR